MAASSSSWKPGQSGNPGGRPKAVQEIRDLIASRSQELVNRAIQIAATTDDEDLAQRTIFGLLDRIGLTPMKNPEAVTNVFAGGSAIRDLTPDEITRRLRDGTWSAS